MTSTQPKSWRRVTRWRLIFFFAALILLVWLWASFRQGNLIAEVFALPKPIREEMVAVDDIAEKYIHLGTSAQSAITTLQKEGFRIFDFRPQKPTSWTERCDRIVGGRYDHMFFYKFVMLPDYGIVIDVCIKNDLVFDVRGFYFMQLY